MAVASGDYVMWRWGVGVAEGEVLSVHQERVTLETRKKIIARNGTKDNPALRIRHTSGSLVLKLQSEVKKAT